MRIVIDMQGAQSDSRFRGMGRYSLQMALALARQAQQRSGHEVWLALNSDFRDSVLDIRHAFAGLVDEAHIRCFTIPGAVYEVDANNAWRTRVAEHLREQFIQSLQPDVVYVTSLFEGFGDNAVTSVGQWISGHRTAVTMYDLIPHLHPDQYLTDPLYKAHYARKLASLQRAGLLVAISDSSRQEAIDHLNWPADAIVSAPLAVDDKFRPTPLGSADTQALLARYGISRAPVLFAPGGFDARKNFAGLMQAYAQLPLPLRRTHQLVIASKLSKDPRDDSRAKLFALRDQAGLSADELVLTDFVPDHDLVPLYTAAKLFVFPSKHEGFGLPPLEAMACGCPTIGSDRTSIPQVLGWSEALFNPDSPSSMAAKMQQALSDDGFRQTLQQRGLAHVQTFSWDASAKLVLDAFERMHARAAPAPSLPPVPALLQTLRTLPPLAGQPDHLWPVHDGWVDALKALSFNTPRPSDAPRQLLLGITELVRWDAKSGIQRVVRSILQALLQSPPAGFVVHPVYFDGRQYRHAHRFMARFNAYLQGGDAAVAAIPTVPGMPQVPDLADPPVDVWQGDQLLTLTLDPDLPSAAHTLHQRWQACGVDLHFVQYDTVLLQRPDWAPPKASANILRWQQQVCEVATSLACISATVASEVRIWQQAHPAKRPAPARVTHFHLGADVESSAPTQGLPDEADIVLAALAARKSFLMVSTIEPRKGYAQTLAAFELLWQTGADVNLVIVGKEGWHMEDLVEQLSTHPMRKARPDTAQSRLFWLQGVSDEFLTLLYTRCHCLINASEGEGFGLPLIEAARHGLPILSRDLPVFQEVAGRYAHYFHGLAPHELAQAVQHWLALDAKGQAPQSHGMPHLTWAQSAQQLVDGLGLR